MAFRTQLSIARQYDQLKQFAAHVKSQCTAYRVRMASGPVPIYEISSGLLGMLVEAADRFASSTAGMAAYAKAQEGDDTYDVAAEFSAMRVAVVAARDWLVNGLPKDGSGRLLERRINAGGDITMMTVTSAQTATLRDILLTIEATID